jgi:hypothetical protein
MSELPLIDAHEVTIAADAESVWDATAFVAEHLGGRFGPVFARVLGCAETEPEFPRTVAGFRVAAAERPRRLVLSGRHRFSRYALEFATRPADRAGATVLRAETRAEFPGPAGRVYRALVIGSRGHVVAVRRLLGSVKRRAEYSG